MKTEPEKPRRVGRIIFRVVLFSFVILILLSGYTAPGKAFWETASRFVGLSAFPPELPEEQLKIHVLSVGKADAILLEAPGASVLLDTGTADSAETVIRYLHRREIETLDAVVLSHPDSDHIGGLSTILSEFPARAIVLSDVAEYPETVTGAGEYVFSVGAGEQLTYGEIVFDVLSPRRVYTETNENSLVLRLRYGEFSALFCGDIEEDAEEDLLSSGEILAADLLKVAHHGSETSTSAAFLAAVRPKYAVISSGEDRNLLPRSTVLKRIEDAGIRCFRTDRDGTVIFRTDGKEIDWITENGGDVS